MTSHVRSRKFVAFKWLAIASSIVILSALVAQCGFWPNSKQRQRERLQAQILSLISTGMSEADLVKALDDANIRHGETHEPTKNDDYPLVLIPIDTSDSLIHTMEYTITGSGQSTGRKAYIVVTLDQNGTVTSID
ncbi:MAG: hypothetical protein AAGK04_03400 [Planctomycetota bacterium]